MQLGHVHFDFLAEGLTGRSQVGTSVRRSVDDHQLPRLHLVDDLLDGVAIRAALVVDVSHLGPWGKRRICNVAREFKHYNTCSRF